MHKESETTIEAWTVKPSKGMSVGDKVSYISPLIGYILNSEFSGPYLMIVSFILSYLVGVLCVKRLCPSAYGFRTLAQDIRWHR
jgi:hypothetical protein